MSTAAVETSLKKPTVFDYHDYRAFLRDWLEYQKQTNAEVSARRLSLACGFSHGFISHVANEIRSLSTESALTLARHLSLDQNEQKYFILMVELNETTNRKARDKALKAAQKLVAKSGRDPRALESFNYLKEWYYVAIRELAHCSDFQADVDWIRKKLSRPVSKGKVAEALEFLLGQGFLERKSDGQVRPTQRNVSARGGAFQILLGDYHKKMLDLNKTAIDSVAKDARKQVGFTLALDKERFNRVKEILEEAKARIAALESECESADRVYHVNLSAFPLAGGDA